MKHVRLIFLALCLVVWTGFPAPASTSETDHDAARPAFIAVLPFVMHTQEAHSHIQQGILTMLNTRLAWPDQVHVVPRQKIFNVLKELPGENRKQAVSQVAEQTGSRYVLDGSITQLAGSFSIDAVVYDTQTRQHMTFFEQSDNRDELIDKVSRIAADINKQVFDRSTADWERIEQERQAKLQEYRRKNPEHLMHNPQWQQTRESPGWKIWKYLF
jgi:TolB-like protein